MKKVIFAILLPVLFANVAKAQELQQRLDSLMKTESAKFLKSRPGISFSVGIQSGDRTFFYNYGTLAADSKQVPGVNTQYEIGSLTKTFITYILANAVLENKVGLDDDIRKYLEGTYPNLEYRGQPIRLRHLANTTSRLSDWLPEVPASLKHADFKTKLSFYRDKNKSDLYKALHTVKLDTVPGYWPRHSNAASQLLVFLLEDIYNEPIAALVEKYVTRPAGMQHTRYKPEGDDIAKGYDGKGNLQPFISDVPYFDVMAGLRSTSADLLHYATYLMDSGKAASVMVTSPDIYVSAETSKVIPYKYKGADPYVYSLGMSWLRYEPEPHGLRCSSDGNTLGFNSYLVIYPESKNAVALLTNHSDADTYKFLPALVHEIAAILLNEK